MNEICFGFHHLTEQSITFSHRHPSSVTTKTSVPKCRCFVATASPRGKPRGRNHKQFTTNEPCCPGSDGSPSWRPLRAVRQSYAAALPPTDDTSKVSQKAKRFLPFGMPAMPQPWRCILRGMFPSLGKPDWGKFFVVCLLGGFTGSCGELHGNALSIDRGLRCCSVRLNTAELNGNVKILCLEVVGEQLVVFALKPNINLNYFSFRSIGRNLGIFANQC